MKSKRKQNSILSSTPQKDIEKFIDGEQHIEERSVKKTSEEKTIDIATQFLEKYKVWFETIMCIILSICAVIVSIQANVIAQNQYIYMKRKKMLLFL